MRWTVADLLSDLPISNADMIGCVQREIGMRKKVYPRWVEIGRMTQDQADREIAIMEMVLRWLIGTARVG